MAETLTEKVAEINDLLVTLNVLTWDMNTQMPPGGVKTRGKQMATLGKIAREKLLSKDLLGALEQAEAQLSEDELEQRAVQQVRAAVDMFERIPGDLVQALAEHKTDAQQVWHAAREANDFTLFEPALSRMMTLNRELADAIGYDDHPYDAMLKLYEPGTTSADLQVLFEQLKEGLLPLLASVTTKPEPRWDFLTRNYPVEKQREAALFFAEKLGYDFDRGRLDISTHPFEISFTRQDVRMTTRYQPDYLPMSLFGTLHETGHALYEQGADPAITRTALTTDFVGLYAVAGTSFGAHESQSRLWENMVGRSRDFWRIHFTDLQDIFPEQLADVDADGFYHAVNRVTPSLIRVEADEVTYNLHIMLRAELEMDLVAGNLATRDLPEAWNERVRSYLGISVPNDREGVLQDIHWSAGHIGSFPSYTVGNVMAAQWLVAARTQDKGVDEGLLKGDYAPLHRWLTDNMYRFGRAYSSRELLERATGKDVSVTPYLTYLSEKYGDLYTQATARNERARLVTRTRGK